MPPGAPNSSYDFADWLGAADGQWWLLSAWAELSRRTVLRWSSLWFKLRHGFQVVQGVPYRLVKSEVSYLPQRSHSGRRPVIPQNAPRYARIDPNRAAPPMVKAFCAERSAWFGQSRVVSKVNQTSPIDWSSQNFRTPHSGGTAPAISYSLIFPQNAPIRCSFYPEISHLCTAK